MIRFKRPHLGRWIGAALVLLLAGWLVWRYALPHAVPALRAQAGQLQLSVRGAGELTALEQADIAGPPALTVRVVPVEAGDWVPQGQALLRFDDEDARAQVRAGEAAAQAAGYALTVAQQAHERALVIHAQARADAGRAAVLHLQGGDAISASETEALATAAETSRLDTEVSRLQIASAQRALVQAQAELDSRRVRLRETVQRAPFDAWVTSRRCSAGDMLTSGSSCLTLVQPSSLRVRARFDETALSEIRVGDGAALWLKSQPERAVHGRVERIHRTVDTDTREFTADLWLEELPPAWALGERATVEVQGLATPVALSLPLAFLSTEGGRRGVWVEHQGRARWVALQLGRQDDTQVEVRGGLDARQWVLAPQGLSEGRRVRPVPDLSATVVAPRDRT